MTTDSAAPVSPLDRVLAACSWPVCGLALLAALGLELAATLAIWNEPAPGLDLAAALGAHGLAGALFAVGIAWPGERAARRAWLLLGLVLGLGLFPLFGMAGLLVVRMLHLRARPADSATATVDGRATIQGTLDVWELEGLHDASLLETMEIEPLVDLLRDPDMEVKRAAIDAASRVGGSRWAQAIAGLLRDPSPELRLYASISLTRLEHQIVTRIGEAQHRVDEEPTSPLSSRHLAEAYFAYSQTGLLDETMRRFYLQQAQQTYREALGLDPDDRAAALGLGSALLDLGHLGEAAAQLDRAIELQPTSVEARLLRMRLSYDRGDYQGLPEQARHLLAVAGEDPVAEHLARWWLPNEEPTPASDGDEPW